MSVQVLEGDCRELLGTIPSDSVHCVVTSPPYFGLRDYGHADQIGLEGDPAAYVDQLVIVFREVRRVLHSSGTVWLNLGTSYANGRIESQEYVLRDDLSDQERSYVYAELSKHFAQEASALSQVRDADGHDEPPVPIVPPERARTSPELRGDGV